MKKRTLKKALLTLLLVVVSVFALSLTASAAPKNSWYAKDGRYYYYNSKGQVVTGLQKINGKYYYFNHAGRQRNGWVLSKDRYFFFRNEKGANGYLLTNTTVNGIKIQSNGQAVVTKANKEKLRLLVEANIVAYYETNLTQTKAQRLQKCFNYCVKKIKYKNIGSFRKTLSTWPEYYAATVFDKGAGDCYSGGCAFAYLATAVGYENVWAVSSGGHGWCKIGSAVYDPNWAAMTGKTSRYFGITKSQLTKSDPGYFKAEYYLKRVDK
ncbi:MAG: hypothetical protein KBT01_02595 [Clostridiales bacterium]|nr:hypothetical protein [Candidatus Blautia equi]